MRIFFKLRTKCLSCVLREPAPERRSVDQLRGIEGARVRKTYELLAKQYGVTWHGYAMTQKDWEKGDIANQCVSAATACLYGVTEAAVICCWLCASGRFYPHRQTALVCIRYGRYFKFETVVPVAFRIAAKFPSQPDREVRMACRELFRESRFAQTHYPNHRRSVSCGVKFSRQHRQKMLRLRQYRAAFLR